jgi:hypothetical protein
MNRPNNLNDPMGLIPQRPPSPYYDICQTFFNACVNDCSNKFTWCQNIAINDLNACINKCALTVATCTAACTAACSAICTLCTTLVGCSVCGLCIVSCFGGCGIWANICMNQCRDRFRIQMSACLADYSFSCMYICHVRFAQCLKTGKF